MKRQEDKRQLGFAFLADVATHDLRTWREFARSTIYAFLVNHTEKRKAILGREALDPPKVGSEDTRDLSYFMGFYKGIDYYRTFFDAVEKEYERRTRGTPDGRADPEPR